MEINKIDGKGRTYQLIYFGKTTAVLVFRDRSKAGRFCLRRYFRPVETDENGRKYILYYGKRYYL